MKTEPICRVLLFGGLGNQLFQIAAAMHVANVRQLVVDTSLIKHNKKSNWFKEHKEWELGEQISFAKTNQLNWLSRRIVGYAIRNSARAINKDDKFNRTLILRKITSIFLSLFVFRNHEVHIANGLGYHSELKSKPGNLLLIGYFQSYRWLTSDENILNNIRKLIGCESTEEKARDESLLQIRLGDFLNSRDFSPIDTTYIKRAIKLIESKQRIRKIEVYSDDSVGAKLISAKLDDYELGFNDAKSESALKSLRSMTAFKNHIISSSTFGFWGAILANQSSNVVAPIPWFKDAMEPKDLIPPGWSRIER